VVKIMSGDGGPSGCTIDLIPGRRRKAGTVRSFDSFDRLPGAEPMLLIPGRPSGSTPALAGCSAAGTPSGSGRLALPETVVIVVVVLVLAALALTGREVSEALTVLVVAVAEMVRRRPGGGPGNRAG
jgi:hypothetical protein